MSRLLLLFMSLFVSLACNAEINNNVAPDIPEAKNDSIMIPRPVIAQRLKGTLDMVEPFYMEFSTPSDVENNLSRFLRKSTLSIAGPAIARKPISLIISHDPSLPSSNEGYHLVISEDGIEIESRAEAGLFYGIQTVLQLQSIYGNAIPTWDIMDWPRFEYRGMHLDVCRHFFSKEFIKKQIRMMSSIKLNRLHLHLTDDEGWRIEIKSHPELTNIGAWRSCKNRMDWINGGRKFATQNTPGSYGGFYSQNDIKEIVAYANQYHITIIPEIEMPGHSLAAVASLPELACTPKAGSPVSEICVGKASTIQIYKDVLKEVMELFPSEYIHLGGDEYWTGYWNNCPDCQALMKREGITDSNHLQGWLFRTMESYLKSHGRKLIGWDEILQGGISPDATLMSWMDITAGETAAKAGHDVIMAPGQYCYFDGCQDSPEKEIQDPLSPPALWNFLTLRRAYSYDPAPIYMTGREHVKGLQACVWTEWMPVESRVEYMVYPRLFAIAEVGWSNLNEYRDYDEFHERALRICDRARKDGYQTFDMRTEIGERPESLQKSEHKAIGCKVIYNHEHCPDFPAEGDDALVNGIHGNWNYRTSWQGFRNMDVTIDLGDVQNIEEVKGGFIQYMDDGICLPGSLEIEISNDGKSYRKIKSINIDPFASKYVYRFFGWQGKDKARYIRYHALPGSNGSFVFCDEVEVR